MSFEDLKLDSQILEILRNKQLEKPTEIQTRSIPYITSGRDVLGVSKTGTGKTLAFLLPIINRLLQSNKSFYCLIITPTRELAIQINKNILDFESLGVKSTLLIGGETMEEQSRRIKEHPHFVVGTPGRICKHIGNLKLSRFKVLVLDEADRFFEEDYKEPMGKILSSLRSKIQRVLFTATVTDSLKETLTKEKIIDVSENNSKIEKLKEFYFLVPRVFKECFLYSFCKNNSDCKIIVFVNMRVTAVSLSCILKIMGIENEVLTGEQRQSKREVVLEGFRGNKYNLLVSTDVGSRGIDIPDIDYVVNFDIPSKTKDYTHRIGRTARAEMTGAAISLVTQYDIPSYQKLEHELGVKIDSFVFEKEYKIYEDTFEEAKEKSIEILKENRKNEKAPEKKSKGRKASKKK
ncbi:ATP-dependent rRNA helicase RRP3 [Nosema granulosis]|uniref:ATP-dependent rRNA helicase RRP3 n=1 Tax=Nosema granulosis TaxID=83296 RepID=A0A9P6H1Q6_9MICR|nr:ATP-dependent rRNA helicase RRP3 [Nosema granulosis]